MLHLLTALLLSTAGMVPADTLSHPDTTRIHLLYGLIAGDHTNNAVEGFRFGHRKILYDALHLPPGAPDSVVSQRMKLGWQQLLAVRASEQQEPVVLFRNLLRESLRHKSGVLLLDAARWQVDLNEMDMVRKKTLMDDLEETYRNNTSTEHAEWLREYKKILQDAGAKYFAEMDYHMRRIARNYQRIRPPHFGFYAVQRNGKWGWVDAKGNTIVPLRYKAVRYNTDRMFEVSTDGVRFELAVAGR